MELLLANLPAIIKAGADIWDYVSKVRQAAQQSGEWTPELEAQFQALLDTAKTAPQWQPHTGQ